MTNVSCNKRFFPYFGPVSKSTPKKIPLLNAGVTLKVQYLKWLGKRQNNQSKYKISMQSQNGLEVQRLLKQTHLLALEESFPVTVGKVQRQSHYTRSVLHSLNDPIQFSPAWTLWGRTAQLTKI